MTLYGFTLVMYLVLKLGTVAMVAWSWWWLLLPIVPDLVYTLTRMGAL